MVKRCVKCKGRLVQGAETCIICGKPIVVPVDLPAAITNDTPISPSRQPAAVSDSHIRLVTAPGEKPVATPDAAPSSPPKPPAVIPGSRICLVTAPGGKTVAIPAAIPGPHIRLVTAPGGKRLKDSSPAPVY